MAYGGYGVGGYGAGGYGYSVGGSTFQGGAAPAQGIGQGVTQSKGKEEEQIFDSRKMFVGCVSKTTAEETFIAFFANFGELEEASLKKSYDGSGHRGFGFVVYKDQAVTDSVMAKGGNLELDGRNLNIELAIPSSMKPPEGVDSTKLFIGNLPKDDTGPSTEELTQYFLQFGEVESVFATRDKGFGFITFKNENSAYKALGHGLKDGQGHTIRENLTLETKWSKPKPVGPMGMGWNMYGGGFGSGGFPGQGMIYAGGGGFGAQGGFAGAPFAGGGGFVGTNGFGGAYAGRFQPY